MTKKLIFSKTKKRKETKTMLSVQLPQHSFEPSITIIISLIALSILLVILMIRNMQVGKHRLHIIEIISQKNIEEIESGMRYTGFRYKMIEQISYNEMVLKFWKPLDSFYNLDDILKKEENIL